MKSLSEEAFWRELDPDSFDSCLDVIEQLKQKASSIKAEYEFDAGCDLADGLIGLYGCYVRTRSRPPTVEQVKELKAALARSRKTGTLEHAPPSVMVYLSIFSQAESLDVTNMTTGEVRRAIREAEQARNKHSKGPHERGGRYEDVAENNLIRSLAVLYARGTGKMPATGKSKTTGRYRGRFYRFAKACLSAMETEILDRKIHDVMLGIRPYLSEN